MTSGEWQTLGYHLYVPKPPIQMSGPHPSAQVMPDTIQKQDVHMPCRSPEYHNSLNNLSESFMFFSFSWLFWGRNSSQRIIWMFIIWPLQTSTDLSGNLCLHIKLYFGVNSIVYIPRLLPCFYLIFANLNS